MAVLATWRVTHLVGYEDGPWDVIVRLRRRAGGGFFGKLMDCFYCSSLWVSAAAAFALRPRLRDWVLLWLAISGAACLLNRLGHEPVLIERLREPQGETNDVVLRRESGEREG